MTQLAEQDWRLLLAALVVSTAGSGACAVVIRRAVLAGSNRVSILAVATLVSAAALWTAHTLILMGDDVGSRLAVNPAEAAFAFTVALLGCAAGCALASGAERRFAVVGGAALGVVLASLTVLGPTGIRGAPAIEWSPVVVGLAYAIAVTGGGLGLLIARRSGKRHVVAGGLIGGVTILTVHLVALSGATLAANAPPLGGTVITEVGVSLLIILGALIGVAGAALVFMAGVLARTATLDRLREAIDAMPDGLAFFDAEDRLVVWNARYAEMNPEAASMLKAGKSFESLIRFELEQGHYPEAEGRQEAWLAQRMATRKLLSSTVEQRTADGAWLRVQDRRTADGGLVTVVNDISDLKRDAAALAEARDAAEAANRAKSEFLANMSHEIRTPLNGVIGISEALASTGLDQRQREMLQLVQSSSATLKQLLSDILDLARVESGRMEITCEPFDLGQTMREAGRLYADAAETKGLTLQIEIAPDAEGWVSGDCVRLKQVLTNLVSNAVKFTERGLVSLSAARRGDFMRFTVEDTGIGFDPAQRDRLFQRFEQADGATTRRFGGSGLGLPICRQLTEMMGGTLDCESEPGGGSAFLLDLPLIPTAAPAHVQPIPATDLGRPIRVLLADDHAVNRRVVELILEPAGAELVAAETGFEALSRFRAEPFDIVLMDMQMPVMDGLTATKEIRLHEATMGLDPTPVIMLTANALPEHIAAGAAAGADAHLAKPFSAADLIQAVSTAVASVAHQAA